MNSGLDADLIIDILIAEYSSQELAATNKLCAYYTIKQKGLSKSYLAVKYNQPAITPEKFLEVGRWR